MNSAARLYRIAYWISAGIIGLILLSGYHKILYPEDFALSVYRFHIVPGFLINPVALFVPWLELVCVACLLFVPRYRVAALGIILALLSVFTVAICVNLWRGSVFGCGCFGRGATDDPLSWLHVVRNLGLILLAVLALVARKKTAGSTAD